MNSVNKGTTSQDAPAETSGSLMGYRGEGVTIAHWTGLWAMHRRGTVVISDGLLTLCDKRGQVVKQAPLSRVSAKIGLISRGARLRMNDSRYLVIIDDDKPHAVEVFDSPAEAFARYTETALFVAVLNSAIESLKQESIDDVRT